MEEAINPDLPLLVQLQTVNTFSLTAVKLVEV